MLEWFSIQLNQGFEPSNCPTTRYVGIAFGLSGGGTIARDSHRGV